MAVKFSQFTEETVASNITRIVGYTASGNINVQIPPANLDTTYSFATSQDGSNVDLTLTGTKTGSSSTTEVLQFTAGSGITLTAGTDEITIDAVGAVTSVDETTPGTSSGTPIVVNPTTGTVLVQSMAYAGTTNVGHVPTGGSGSTFLRGDGTWATPAGGFTSFDIAGDSGTETVNSGDTITFTGGTNITTAVTATDTVTFNLSGTIWTAASNYGTNRDITPGETLNIKAGTQQGEATTTVVGAGVYTTGASGSDLISLDQAADLKITVVNPGSGNKYYVDGALQSTVVLPRGFTYEFNQIDSSNDGHPLFFSTTSNGTHGGGTAYTTGIKCYGNGAAVSFADYVSNFASYTSQRSIRIRVTQNTPTLYYYCYYHSGMGGPVAYGATSGLASRTVDSFTISNSSTNSITVTSATDPTSKDYIDVYINGVYQAKANFSALSGKTLTLAAGNFPNGSTVEAVTTT